MYTEGAGGAVVSTAPSQQEGSWFDSWLGLGSRLSFHVACEGTPASSQRHVKILPSDAKVWLFASLYQPCGELATCPGCFLPHDN